MKITVSDHISETPEKIFPWIENPEKAKQWQKNVKGGSTIKKDSEIVGTTFTETIEQNGRELTMSGTITRYQKNSHIGFHIESKIHSFDVSYILKKDGQLTNIAIEADIQWKFPMNIISFFMGEKITNNITKDLENEIKELKILVECY